MDRSFLGGIPALFGRPEDNNIHTCEDERPRISGRTHRFRCYKDFSWFQSCLKR